MIELHRRKDLVHLLAYLLQIGLVLSILLSLLYREKINARFLKAFPTKRQFSVSLTAVLLSVSVALLLAEGLARVFHVPFNPQWTPSENPLARFDSELGWSYIPGNKVTQKIGSDNREISMYFDDLGCRSYRPGGHADRSAPTLLFVGDSFTFGHGVSYEDSFVGQIAARPDIPLQVVNLGVQAYGTDQSLLLLKRQFKKFNTKVVVFTFTTPQIGRNEVYDRRLLFPDGLFLGTKPMFKLNRDNSLVLVKRPLLFKDYSYSHLWAAIQLLELRWMPRPGPRLTRALINDMREYVEANGAKFILVDWFPDQDFPWGLNLDVVRVSANSPPGWDSWVIPGDGHPDARAHHYASELMAKEIAKSLNASH